MLRLQFSRCGDFIHPDTASRNAGLCVPCIRGNQLSIEARVRRHKEEREAREAVYAPAEFKYRTALIKRVYAEADGLARLPHPERIYYLVNVFSGEVRYDGFDQFFTNSRGEHYAETIAALKEVGAHHSLSLLRQAKTILFASREAPRNRAARFAMMATWEESHPDYGSAHEALHALDKQFYADPDNIGDTLERLAKANGLYLSDSLAADASQASLTR